MRDVDISTMSYSESVARSIISLNELQPGDHVLVPCYSGSSSSFSSGRKGHFFTHHLLVVSVADKEYITVIHKVIKGVVEEKKRYSPEQVTVLDYDSEYTGQVAIARARERIGEKHSFASDNCEHFVTEVRTGQKESSQVQGGVAGGAIGVGSGAMVGAGAGAGAGALIGGGIGSVFPGVGTLFGGAVGAIIGIFSGGAVIGAGGGGAGTFIGIKYANFFKRKKKND